jgi:predicted GIY-YIG superfamily endonuclease
VKPFWLYMLRCADGSYYVGHTDDLEKRVAEHQAAAIPGHTCARRPVSLVYAAEMVTRDEAIQRERQLKGWSRAKKEALVRGDWERVHTLARGPDRVRPSTPLRSAQGERTFDDATPRSAQGERGELFESAAPRPPIRSS